MEVQKKKIIKYYTNKVYYFGNITTCRVKERYAKIKHQLNNICTDELIDFYFYINLD